MNEINILRAIILGIIQGISEFLPISSTGHLTLAGKLMNIISQSDPEKWTRFIAVIQLGTMVSIFVYFWKDLWNIAVDFLKYNIVERKKYKEQNLNSKLGWMIIIGTLPIVTIGIALKKVIEGNLTKNLAVIAGSLIVVAVLMFVAEKVSKFKKEIEDLTWVDALVIGIAQCFALIPGSSRSGTTLTAGLFLNIKRDAAARFSFLLSIPAVLASGLLELKEALPTIQKADLISMGVATFVSFISGYIAIDFLLKYLKKNSTLIFIVYRILIGIVIFVLIGTKIISL